MLVALASDVAATLAVALIYSIAVRPFSYFEWNFMASGDQQAAGETVALGFLLVAGLVVSFAATFNCGVALALVLFEVGYPWLPAAVLSWLTRPHPVPYLLVLLVLPALHGGLCACIGSWMASYKRQSD